MLRRILTIIFSIIGGIVLLLISLMSLSNATEIDSQLNLSTLIAAPNTITNIETQVDIDDLPFQDNMQIYELDDSGSIVYMFVTIRPGNSSDNTNYTWEEINESAEYFYSDQVYVSPNKAEVILQIGDENGPVPGELGYGAVIPNGTIQVRGPSASLAPQKSYKIELFNSAGLWRGQRTIALNKHVPDVTRVKNKLCFDLIKDISGLVSLRTQFVHLFVKDETGEEPSELFVDYGLFTQIEQPNRRFLRNHLLDPDGQLYKSTFFEFFRYKDEIKPVDASNYDLTKFESILEVKGNQDHSKLIQMLEELNDPQIPIEETFEKYFDSENYFTWLAFNILVGNVSTRNQNFYLYSPKNSLKWYFIPWDYDGAFKRQDPNENNELWEYGVSNYWGSILHRRVLKVEKYRESLDDKVAELYNFLSPERINELLETYRPVVEPLISNMPDVYYFPGTLEEYDEWQNILADEIQINYELYLDSLEKPTPFFMGTPEWVNGKIKFTWGDSYSFDTLNLVYEIEVSRNWEFSEIVFRDTIANLNSILIDPLEPGTYFWRVVARNDEGKEQFAFDSYIDPEGGLHSGMKYFYISADGEIFENEIQE